MSAYVMDYQEFDTIVSYFVNQNHAHGEGAWLKIGDKYNYLNKENAGEVARILFEQNVRSVQERYQDGAVSEYDYKFHYDLLAHERPVGNIIGALECYEYQACETDDWHTSNAWEIVCGLRKHLLKTIAEKDGTYTWGIE